MAMGKTGPNDMSDVSFGPKVCFHFFFVFLLILTNFFCLFRFYSCYKWTGRVGLAGDEKNGPKRRVLHCLGHRYVFF